VEGAQFSVVQIADDLIPEVPVRQWLGPFDLSGWKRWTILAVTAAPPEVGNSCISILVLQGVEGFNAHERNEFTRCDQVHPDIDPSPDLSHWNSVRSAQVLMPSISIGVNGPPYPADIWLYLQR
jgi:hypothetical protein